MKPLLKFKGIDFHSKTLLPPHRQGQFVQTVHCVQEGIPEFSIPTCSLRNSLRENEFLNVPRQGPIIVQFVSLSVRSTFEAPPLHIGHGHGYGVSLSSALLLCPSTSALDSFHVWFHFPLPEWDVN